jgi:hypothetical protein
MLRQNSHTSSAQRTNGSSPAAIKALTEGAEKHASSQRAGEMTSIVPWLSGAAEITAVQVQLSVLRREVLTLCLNCKASSEGPRHLRISHCIDERWGEADHSADF